MSTSELIITIVAVLAITAALLGWHYAIVYRNRIDELARLLPGCCPMCGGGGVSGEESTGGKCWDCQGTGHPHAGPCMMPWDRAMRDRARDREVADLIKRKPWAR